MEGVSISKTKSNMASKKPNACESWCFSYPLEICEGRIDLLTQRDLEFWVNSKPTHNLHALVRMKTFYKPMTFHSYSKLAKGCIYQALEILPQEWRWKGLQYRSCPRGGSACIPRRSTFKIPMMPQVPAVEKAAVQWESHHGKLSYFFCVTCFCRVRASHPRCPQFGVKTWCCIIPVHGLLGQATLRNEC